MDPSPRRSPRIALQSIGKNSPAKDGVLVSPTLKRRLPTCGTGLENEIPPPMLHSAMRLNVEVSPTLPARRRPRRSSGHNKRVSFGGETIKFIEHRRDNAGTPPVVVSRVPFPAVPNSTNEDTVTMPSLHDILNQSADESIECPKFVTGANFYEEDITQCGPLHPRPLAQSDEPTFTINASNIGPIQSNHSISGDSPIVTSDFTYPYSRQAIDPDEVTMPAIRLATLADEDELEEEYARAVARQGFTDEDVSITTKIPSIAALLQDDGSLGHDYHKREGGDETDGEDTIDGGLTLAQLLDDDDTRTQLPQAKAIRTRTEKLPSPPMEGSQSREQPVTSQCQTSPRIQDSQPIEQHLDDLPRNVKQPNHSPLHAKEHMDVSRSITSSLVQGIGQLSVSGTHTHASVPIQEDKKKITTFVEAIYAKAGLNDPKMDKAHVNVETKSTPYLAEIVEEHRSVVAENIDSVRAKLRILEAEIESMSVGEKSAVEQLDSRTMKRIRAFCDARAAQQVQGIILQFQEKIRVRRDQELHDLADANLLLTERSEMYRRNICEIVKDTNLLRLTASRRHNNARIGRSDRDRIANQLASITKTEENLRYKKDIVIELARELSVVETSLVEAGTEMVSLRRVTLPSFHSRRYFNETVQASVWLAECSGLKVKSATPAKSEVVLMGRFLITFESQPRRNVAVSSVWTCPRGLFQGLSLPEQSILTSYVESRAKAIGTIDQAMEGGPNGGLGLLISSLFILQRCLDDAREAIGIRGGSVTIVHGEPDMPPFVSVVAKFSSCSKLHRFFCCFEIGIDGLTETLRCTDVRVDFGDCPTVEQVRTMVQGRPGRRIPMVCDEISNF